MKYIVKVTHTCPEGAVTGHIYHVLDQAETEALLSFIRESDIYADITVIGIAEPINKRLKKHIDKILTSNKSMCHD